MKGSGGRGIDGLRGVFLPNAVLHNVLVACFHRNTCASLERCLRSRLASLAIVWLQRCPIKTLEREEPNYDEGMQSFPSPPVFIKTAHSQPPATFPPSFNTLTLMTSRILSSISEVPPSTERHYVNNHPRCIITLTGTVGQKTKFSTFNRSKTGGL